MASQYEWHLYCSSIWKYDNQCFWDALWLYYSMCVHNYGGTLAQVRNWTLSQMLAVMWKWNVEHWSETLKVEHTPNINKLYFILNHCNSSFSSQLPPAPTHPILLHTHQVITHPVLQYLITLFLLQGSSSRPVTSNHMEWLNTECCVLNHHSVK